MLFSQGERIVFAGDSVTDMGSEQPVGEGIADCLGRGYVRVIESLLAAVYPEIDLRITNSGVAGDSSRQLLSRYERDVIALKPDWVSICIGINDVWRQLDTPAIYDYHVLPEEYEQNIEQMILSIKDSVKGIFLLTPYYIEPNPQDKMRAKMDVYVDICKELAKKHGCILIDFQEMYANYCAIRHSSALAWDRVHPNQIGATLMAREFLKACDFDYEHVPDIAT